MSRTATRKFLGALLGGVVLAGMTASAAPAQLPSTTDPRANLTPGMDNAGTAQRGMELRAHLNKPAVHANAATEPVFAISGANSDMAFQGNYAFVGNFNGFTIYDISNPSAPVEKTVVVCPGGQGDLSVYRNLLFMSVEETRAKKDCTLTPAATSATRFRGVRIFDISNIEAPQHLGGVQTCRGSHTHTLVEGKDDPNSVYIYVQGTSGTIGQTDDLTSCDAGPATNPNPSQWRIEVIKVPLAAPATASIVNEPRLFRNEAGAVNGLQNAPPAPQHPCASAPAPTCDASTNGATNGAVWQPVPDTNSCHDITVYEKFDLAAGSCEGNGILIDISNPANPVRIDAVSDPNYAYWHGATFSNDGKKVVFTDEWGGGTNPRCRAMDDLKWGGNSIYEIVNRKLVFRSYYKLPVAQDFRQNCVSHLPSLIPVPGRDIMVQAWYQGGASLIDFTDASNPKEIGYFDRGPIEPNVMWLGGFWSTYYHNGAIYASEIRRGFDVFRLTPTSDLSQAELDFSAKARRTERSNWQSQEPFTWDTPVGGDVNGNVPATLSLTLGTPASFGALTPGVTRTYEASMTGNVISTAGNALLSVADPSSTHTGHLVNTNGGTFFLPQPLQARARNAANTGTAYNNVGSSASPLNLLTWSGPISNDALSLQFSQLVNANDALRTGTYSKTLTFTLSTTQP
jgi:LVIVD repeat